MKICTIIILFHPDEDSLSMSLPAFSNESDGIIIWRNSIISESCQQIINKFEKVIVAGDGTNVGIATALNKSIKIAEEKGYSHVLTMDQDSYFDDNMISNYKLKVTAYDNDTIGVFGVNPLQSENTLYEVNSNVLNVADTITSGSVFKILNFAKTGYFKDDLFIDAVDYEYCYRIKSLYSLQTIVFSDILLNHTVGYVEKTNYGFSVNNYSAFRTYFIIRNQFKIWKMYPQLFPKNYKITLLKDHVLFRIIKIIIAEDKKIMKLKAIVKGFYHFLIDRSGFYNVNSKNN